MIDLTHYQLETTELSNTELDIAIQELNELYHDATKKDKVRIDELREEYLEEVQYRRER